MDEHSVKYQLCHASDGEAHYWISQGKEIIPHPTLPDFSVIVIDSNLGNIVVYNHDLPIDHDRYKLNT